MEDDRIKEIQFLFDFQKIKQDLMAIAQTVSFMDDSICLNHPSHILDPQEQFHFGCGSIFNKDENTFRFNESDFTQFHPQLRATLIPEFVASLCTHLNIEHGRVRILRFLPKTSLYAHVDFDYPRVVVPFDSNKYTHLLFFEDDGRQGKSLHLEDGKIYQINSGKAHLAFNGGRETSYHMVIANKALTDIHQRVKK